jgi:hypothetical protein
MNDGVISPEQGGAKNIAESAGKGKPGSDKRRHE